ncbi:MAG: flagellar basal body L-ring protein FlgH [Deltaproteobacteria bacterium]|nr:flagellar basal body L-ring protein FlgH [Deltaproteobacteria bacterium]
MRTIGFCAVLALLEGCASTHIAPYAPKKRDYEAPAAALASSTAAPGSLWEDGRPATILFTDARALRENDLVVVRVEEVADAKRQADTDLKRSTAGAAKINEFLGLITLLQGSASWLKPEISAESASRFIGEGSTARTERLTATVPALVRKVLPNGNLFVEGHRVILVNNEEHHFYISGVVRPIDIDEENSVKSSMIADAEIEFTGRGVLSDNQEPGWLSKYLGWLWPF